LSPNWEGPFTICRIFETGVVEIIYKNNKKYKVNVARTKPYIKPVQMQTRDINLPSISNYFDPNIRVNQNFVPQPLIPQQQAAAPRLLPPPARPALPLPAQPPPHPCHPNDFDFNLPLRHMNRNLARNFNRALPLGQPVAPLPVPLPANPFVNLTPSPPPPALPAPGMGQPLLVPQFIRQAPVAPPLPLSAIYKQSPFTANQAVASGPSLVSDQFGLPVVKPGFRTPAWIKNRRRFLKKLSPAARNLALTGDPFFTFDNVAYESAWVPQPPPAAAAENAPHPAVADPPPGLTPVHPPLAGNVTPPAPPPVPQPRYPLLAQFRLINFETPPRHLFDRSPP
jgi:hypothetical protein